MPQRTVLGLIVEFNPYHLGHQYFLTQAKALIQPDVTIAITSTSFTMRGEVAITDKFSKTKQMLESGIDIVLELPMVKSVQSADFFAYHSVKALADMGITDIAFGVENDDLSSLYQLLTIIQNPKFEQHLQPALKTYTSYKKAYALALAEMQVTPKLIEAFNQPNVTLALQYLKAIQELKLNIKIHPIKRLGSNYHDTDLHHQMASAKAIRDALRNKRDITNYVPESTSKLSFIDQENVEKQLFTLLKYHLLVNDYDINDIFGISEGIDYYLTAQIKQVANYQDFLNRIKNKRYSISKCQRIFLYILLQIPKNLDQFVTYLRILGFTSTGESYLNTLPKPIKQTIITTLKHTQNPIGLIELKATKLYELLTDNQGLYQNEFLIPLKRKD